MPDGTPTFGELLRRYRLEASLSQQTLAERAQLSVDAIAALERGRRRPRPATIGLLIAALQLPLAQQAALSAAAHAHDTGTVTLQKLPALPLTPLPTPPTQLIGRERELRTATRLLRPTHPADAVRLLTLIGPGGVGKTRLALAVATAIADAFANQVHFISLASIRDPTLVPLSILQHLGLPEMPELRAEQQIIAALRDEQTLLVLDNLEQVLAAAPLIATLLSAAPRLQVLATSRTPLRLYGEQELHVPPLQLPASPDRWVAVPARMPRRVRRCNCFSSAPGQSSLSLR